MAYIDGCRHVLTLVWTCVCSVFNEVGKVAPLSVREMNLLRSCKTSGRDAVRYKPAWCINRMHSVIFVTFVLTVALTASQYVACLYVHQQANVNLTGGSIDINIQDRPQFLLLTLDSLNCESVFVYISVGHVNFIYSYALRCSFL